VIESGGQSRRCSIRLRYHDLRMRNHRGNSFDGRATASTAFHHASHSPPYLGILLAVRSDSPRALPHDQCRDVSAFWNGGKVLQLLIALEFVIKPILVRVCGEGYLA